MPAPNVFVDVNGALNVPQAWRRACLLDRMYRGDWVRAQQIATAAGFGVERQRIENPGYFPPRQALYESATAYNFFCCGVSNAAQYPAVAAGYVGIPDSNFALVNVFFNNMYNAYTLPILQALATDPAKTLIVYGHSYGGAVAQIAAWRAWTAAPTRSIAFCSIGQPRVWTVGGNWPNVDAARVQDQQDPVVHLPPNGNLALAITSAASFLAQTAFYRHYGPGYGFNPNVGTVPFDNIVEPAITLSPSLLTTNVLYHGMPNYLTKLYGIMSPAEQAGPITQAIIAIVDGAPPAAPTPPATDPPATAWGTLQQLRSWFQLTAQQLPTQVGTYWANLQAVSQGGSVQTPPPNLILPPQDQVPLLPIPNPLLPGPQPVHPNVVGDP